MSNERAEALAETVIEAINGQDFSQVEKLCTAHVHLRLPPAQVWYGTEGVREFLGTLQRMIPQMTFTADRIYSGDDYAIVEYETAGRTAGGTDEEAMGVLILQLDGEQIRRVQVYLDTAQWERIHKVG